MKRVLIALAALVLVAGSIRTAYSYGLMVGTAEANSAPSGVAFFVIVPYLAVGLLLLLIAMLVGRQKLGDESVDLR